MTVGGGARRPERPPRPAAPGDRAPGLPTGTVTFLLTDVEGSSRLWEQHADHMRQALARHDALIETAVERHGGYMVRPRGEGDGRFAVFARATEAVAAGAAIQRALHAESWLAAAPLRVRLALHTGEADVRDGDYFGSAVNRCARLRAIAHGGQALLSQATHDLVRDALPEGVGVRDLGEHRLAGLARPERVFQLLVSGVPADFPPLRSPDAVSHSVPLQVTSFVGRERELAEVRRLLGSHRLVTLTGPGGVGKTRLALQVAGEISREGSEFADGVCVVPLEAVSDPDFVAPAVARALALLDMGERPLSGLLADYLRDKRLLLLLDNFERVVRAAPLVTELLAASAGLKVLVTSRVVLGVYGEHQYLVPPLRVPEPGRRPAAGALTAHEGDEAVRLFVERASAVKPDFVLSSENAAAVAAICARLDGLPLAIELAATRLPLLPPAALLARLDRRLRVLTGGPRDAPARQRTLRATLDWSHDLLGAGERVLFRRLAVFAGGATLQTVEEVCAAGGDLPVDVLEGLGSLVDGSLLRWEEGAAGEAPRYSMLDVVREYALECLEASGEADAVHRRHAEHFLALAQAAPQGLDQGPALNRWLDALERDLGNFRVALEWWLARGEGEPALRLAVALWTLWGARLHLTEGQRWLERALAAPGVPPALRADGLLALANLRQMRNEYAAARALLEESLSLRRTLGDRRGAGRALFELGAVARNACDFAAAEAFYEEAASLVEEPLAARIRSNIGAVAHGRGDLPRARRLLEQSLAELQSLRPAGWSPGWLLWNLGNVARDEGDAAAARARYAAALTRARDLEMPHFATYVLLSVARLDAEAGRLTRAVRLLGAADGLRRLTQRRWPLVDERERERVLALVRSSLPAPAFDEAYAEGGAWSLEEAVGFALEDGEHRRPGSDAAASTPAGTPIPAPQSLRDLPPD